MFTKENANLERVDTWAVSRIGKWLESAHIGELVSDDRAVGKKMEGSPIFLPDQLTLSQPGG